MSEPNMMCQELNRNEQTDSLTAAMYVASLQQFIYI